MKTDLSLETQRMVWKLSYVSFVNENVKRVFSSEETQCHSFSAVLDMWSGIKPSPDFDEMCLCVRCVW